MKKLGWVLGAVFFGALALLPYSLLSKFLKTLTSDGSFESLTIENAPVFKAIFAFAALILLLIAWLATFRYEWISGLVSRLGSDARTLREDFRPQFETRYLIVLLVVMLFSLIVRLPGLNGVMLHDESYTAIAFGSSLRSALTDYHLPNNHVFHSLLVYISTSLFGFVAWAVRLPVLIAGVLIIPAVYLLGAKLYNRETGLLTALLASFSPALIHYANDARGYGLMALFTLLALIFADHIHRYRSLLGWSLLAIACALGFFTLPTMILPFGMIFGWLFLEGLFDRKSPYRSKVDFLVFWAVSGLGTAALSLLFYAPIFIYSGTESFFGNAFAVSLPWELFKVYLPEQMLGTLRFWTVGTPLLVKITLVIGIILSLLFHRRVASHRFHILLAAFLWLMLFFIFRRPYPFSKIWLFFNPLLTLWVAAGLFAVLASVRVSFISRWSLFQVLLAGSLLFALVVSVKTVATIPAKWAEVPELEQLVLNIKDQLSPGDYVVLATPDDAPFWFYSKQHDIPSNYFDSSLPRDRLWIFVDSYISQTLESVLAERAPDVDCSSQNTNVVQTTPVFTIYECLLP